MIIQTSSYPRAALIGNPSDGYFGKTIAFVFGNFSAKIVLYQTPELEILPNDRDHSRFTSIDNLVEDVNRYGYYGGIRLLKATVKKFFDYCHSHRIQLDKRNFTIRYDSDIPHQLGLAGSSAIITACIRALMSFYSIEIPRPIMANLVLSVEVEELDIAAGLQDRVAQAYQQPVFMDFDEEIMKNQGYGDYQLISSELLPKLYIAYKTVLSEDSSVTHSDLRERYMRGDKDVLDAIKEWKELTLKFHEALIKKQKNLINEFINRNFDIRRSVCQISEENLNMVETARKLGASAKFTGSGGAIIGTYQDENMFESLCETFEKKKIQVLKPKIITG